MHASMDRGEFVDDALMVVRIPVVQTVNGYSAEAIKDSQESISTPAVAYPSANEALDAARAVADADAERVLQVR